MINILAIVVWQTKNMTLVSTHSLLCEFFYDTIKDAETACIQIMKLKNCHSKTMLFFLMKIVFFRLGIIFCDVSLFINV